jgi:nucleotide-binding universal stress UspA family protein
MIEHILIPLDGSPISELALTHGAALAQAHDADVTLFRAIDDAQRQSFSSAAIESRLRLAEARSYLEEHAADLRARGIRTRVEVREGPAAGEISEFVREAGVDVIALSTHGESGVGAFPMGSVAWKVVADGAASVLLVRAGGPQADRQSADYGTVMVAVDGSLQADWALCLAAGIARAQGAELLIVQAVPVPQMTRRLPLAPDDKKLQRAVVRANRLAARANLRECSCRLASEELPIRTRVVVTPHVAETLHQIARTEHVGLLVASAHGSSGPSRSAYGSVATHLVDHGETPTLVFQDNPRRNRDTSPSALGEVHTSSGGLQLTGDERHLSGNGVAG